MKFPGLIAILCLALAGCAGPNRATDRRLPGAQSDATSGPGHADTARVFDQQLGPNFGPADASPAPQYR